MARETGERNSWRFFPYLPPGLTYSLGLGPLVGGRILMLGTTGRKTGLRRKTPLLYDEIEGCYYVGSARGENADWYLHLLANPRVTIRMVSHQFRAYTWPATDPEAAVDFIEQRLKGNSRPGGTLIPLKGVGREPARDQLL